MTAHCGWCTFPSTGRIRPFRVHRPNWKAECVERCLLRLEGGKDCKVLPILTPFKHCACNWADPPIQNRRIRRCGGGLAHVPSYSSSKVRTEGRDHGSHWPSRPFVISQDHIGILACA